MPDFQSLIEKRKKTIRRSSSNYDEPFHAKNYEELTQRRKQLVYFRKEISQNINNYASGVYLVAPQEPEPEPE